MNHIKQGLCTKPTSPWCAHRLVCEGSISVINLDRLATTTGSSSICQELCIAAFLQAHKPKHRLFNSITDGQQAMTLKKRCLLITQRFRDILTFFLSQHNTLERVIKCQILIPSAKINKFRNERKHTLWKAQASCDIISSGRPSEQNARPCRLWLCAAQLTSGRAA